MAAAESAGRQVSVRIDGRSRDVEKRELTGRELRQLAGLPGAEDHDLFLEQPGLAEDRRLDDNDVVEIRDGMRFFSTPRAILMG